MESGADKAQGHLELVEAINMGSRFDHAMTLWAVPLGVATLLGLAGPGQAQTPATADAAMDNLPSLRDQTTGGTFRCPDGSTRTFSGEPPSALVVAMTCDVPADVATARNRQAQAAVDAKNTRAEQQAALGGQSGVVAGLDATARTGRPDFLLRSPLVWILAVVLGFAALGALISWQLKGKP